MTYEAFSSWLLVFLASFIVFAVIAETVQWLFGYDNGRGPAIIIGLIAGVLLAALIL